MKKLINMNVVREAQQVKGLLLAKLNLKRPMVIEFANKTAANLVGYAEDEIVGKIINDFMPSDVSKYHQKFIDDYLVTGKEKMINQRTA